MPIQETVRQAQKLADEWLLKHREWQHAKTLEVTVIENDTLKKTVRFSAPDPTSGKRRPLSVGVHERHEGYEIKAVLET